MIRTVLVAILLSALVLAMFGIPILLFGMPYG